MKVFAHLWRKGSPIGKRQNFDDFPHEFSYSYIALGFELRILGYTVAP